MNHWEKHDLAPAGSLKKGETHISVLDTGAPPKDKAKEAAWNRRMDDLKPPSYPPIDDATRKWEHVHERYKQQVRNDKSYQFIMKVAAFANMKLDNMWNTPSEEPGKTATSAGGGLGDIQTPLNGPVDRRGQEQSFQHKWTTIPEVSGLVYLNPIVFGHLHEAYEIINTEIELEAMMVNDASTLFARLVALRIKMSAFLSGLNYNLDKNYQRILQQQSMCVKAIRKKINRQCDVQHTTYAPTQWPTNTNKMTSGLRRYMRQY